MSRTSEVKSYVCYFLSSFFIALALLAFTMYKFLWHAVIWGLVIVIISCSGFFSIAKVLVMSFILKTSERRFANTLFLHTYSYRCACSYVHMTETRKKGCYIHI